MVPYISGIYGAPAATRVLELPSLVENDGYFISCSLMDILGSVYDPGATNSRNPLCWPYHASIEELADLPVGSRNQDWITPPPVHIRGSVHHGGLCARSGPLAPSPEALHSGTAGARRRRAISSGSARTGPTDEGRAQSHEVRCPGWTKG